MDDEASLRPNLELFTPAPDEKISPAEKRSRKQLAALATIGLGRDAFAVLLEFSGIKLTADDRRYLLGPLVVHNTPWMADIPEWMPPQAFAERAEIILLNDKRHIVGPTEMAAVMMPAIMEAPLRSETSDLYIWAGAAAATRYYKNHKAIAIAMGGHIPKDKDVLQRGGRLWEDYRQLAHEIRRKVIVAQAARDRRPAPPPGQPRPKDPDVVVIAPAQLNLFDEAA